MATVVVQHLNEPVVESAHFQHRDERFAFAEPFSRQLLEERMNLLRPPRDLPGQNDVPAIVGDVLVGPHDKRRQSGTIRVEHGRQGI